MVDVSLVGSVLLSLALGVGLSAAAGFRIFIPFLAASIAALTGHLDLGGWSWIGTYPALVVFVVASVVEVGAYFIPWLDNLLDTIATPAAIVAGIVLTASVLTEVSPLLRWSMAIIAGGGTAATIQIGTVAIRGISSGTTLGFGNFAVAGAELIGSIVTSVLAILIPLVALVLVIVLIFLIVRQARSLRRRGLFRRRVIRQ